MPLQIVQYIAIALGGWFAGETVKDAITHNASGASQPASYALPQMLPHAEPSQLSPYMLICAAILLIAIAYCVKTVIISVRSCVGRQNHHDYYQ